MRVEAVKSMHIRMALRLWATFGLRWDRSGRRSPVASIKRPLDEVNDVSRAAHKVVDLAAEPQRRVPSPGRTLVAHLNIPRTFVVDERGRNWDPG